MNVLINLSLIDVFTIARIMSMLFFRKNHSHHRRHHHNHGHQTVAILTTLAIISMRSHHNYHD